MNYFCLTQSIDTPTRGDAILDLVISNCPENVMDIDVCDSLGSSDHNIVNFNLAGKLSRPYQAPKLVYDYKNANWESFRNDLSSTPWDSILNENNVDDVWNDWKGLFMRAVQNNISSKKIKPRRNVPWITSEIRILFRKRKRLWRKAKATQLPSDWTASIITPSLSKIFNISLTLGKLPSEWKSANITPVFKKGVKQTVTTLWLKCWRNLSQSTFQSSLISIIY